jgi:hypothetical protein
VTWRHPESWRKLRSVQVRVLDDGIAVGSVAIAPHSRKLTAKGAVRLVRGDSSVSRKGATARARLALRLDPSVSGRRLRLEVEAVDTRGRRQIERAGTLRAAR